METPVTDTTKLPFDFEAFACTVFCAFVSHGDNNEAAMRSALTEAGFDALLAKSDRADALEAENAALKARIEAAPVAMVAQYMVQGDAVPVIDCENLLEPGQRVRLLPADGES